jgi:hypothetical protein
MMHKMIRTLAVLASFALSTALFGGSVNLLSDSSDIQIDVSGDVDCNIKLIDNSSNQVVAEAIVYWGTASTYNIAWSNVAGVTASCSTAGSIQIYGVPSGDYRIVTTPPFPWNWGSYVTTSGSGCDIVDYDYYSSDQINSTATNYGGTFY